MATLKIYLDTRSVKPGASAPLKFQLTHNRQVTFIPLNIKITPEQWDPLTSSVVNHPRRLQMNRTIRMQYDTIELAMHEIVGPGRRPEMTVKELRKQIMSRLYGDYESDSQNSEKGIFISRFESFIDSRLTEGTKNVYRRTLKHILSFDNSVGNKNFEDIDRHWLQDLDRFMAASAPSPNARAIHFRNIRAVFNDAIDDNITANYPFRKFKIRTLPTRKRSLTVEQFRTLMTYPCEDYQAVYRDIFMLMFYLCGINAVDLLNAKPDAIHNGRLEYIRAKTHKQYSIKIEPEAMELIERYRGRQYLLNIMDTRTSYLDFLRRMDKALKQIGPMERHGLGGKKTRHPLFQDLSQYWCRHTWATIAAELDIPKETIAAGLGHGGNTVTDIYIRFDQKKVDVANRRVIDYVLYDKK